MSGAFKYYLKADFGSEFLGEITKWIGENMRPDEVFGPDELLKWAEDNSNTVLGYITKEIE